jgi:hypothetical protein
MDLAALEGINRAYALVSDEFGIVEFDRSPLDIIVRRNDPGSSLIDGFSSGLSTLAARCRYLEILETAYGRGAVPESVLAY